MEFPYMYCNTFLVIVTFELLFSSYDFNGWNMKYYKLLFLLLISINFHGQESIKGCVVDVHSKEPLAFVNIRFNHDPFLVITSDIDGRFSFISKERIHSLNLYYVGYKPKEIQLDAFTSRTLLIKLEPSNIVLQEIIITAGENPANRIIRKVIENKALNNPENISSFRYLCYNKTIFDFKETDTLHTEQLKVDSVLKGGHAMKKVVCRWLA